MSEAETRKKIAELKSQITKKELSVRDLEYEVYALNEEIEELKKQINTLELSIVESERATQYYESMTAFLFSTPYYAEKYLSENTSTRKLFTDLYCGKTLVNHEEVRVDYYIMCPLFVYHHDFILTFGHLRRDDDVVNYMSYYIDNVGYSAIFTATELKKDPCKILKSTTLTDKAVLLKNGKIAKLLAQPIIISALTSNNCYANSDYFYIVAQIV
mgnify:CR=1 FL=1